MLSNVGMVHATRNIPAQRRRKRVSIRGEAYIVGAFEHPTRNAPDKSTNQLHAEIVRGALDDAGLSHKDVDGFFHAGDALGLGPLGVLDYLGLKPRHLDSTDTGGSAPLIHVSHAAQAIMAGKCDIAVVSLAGRARNEPFRPGTPGELERGFEQAHGGPFFMGYAMCAMRHMHEYGTTSEQLAWIKVAASHHAQYNPHALLKNVVTVEEVVGSPMVAEPLHRLDCCVVTDGGGAVIVTRPEIAKTLKRPAVRVLGAGEAAKGMGAGWELDLTRSGAEAAGRAAFAEARVTPADIDYASIYDSFTITVLMQLEDLGFCAKGEGGRFVADGNLISGVGKLPFNTDGGGLCSNHPASRGGITKIIEAVRQLRGEARPQVQVKDCRLAAVSGIGGSLGLRHGAAALILERD